MPRNVLITKTNAGGNQGPFTIYHTSVAPANVLIAGITRESLEAGWGVGSVPDAYVNFIVVATGACTNTSNTANTSPTPSTPTGLFANTLSSSEISTGWNASTGATGYQLYRSNSPNGVYNLVIDTTATSHIDSFLGSSTTFYYKIAAYNGSNFSALSNSVSVTTTSGGGSQPIQ